LREQDKNIIWVRDVDLARFPRLLREQDNGFWM